MGWFYEMLHVLAYSWRTKWTIMFALVGCCAILLLGDYYGANFELHGSMKAAEEAIKIVIDRLYVWVALAWLVSLILAAVGHYQKDKKIFYNSL
jgi:hypothetical protein